MKPKLFFIAAISLLVSCAKQGPIGPTGEQGPSGTNGSNGATNVKTIIDSVPVSAWSANSLGFSASLVASSINAADSDYVTVAASTANNATATWYGLPYSNFLSSADQMEFSYSRYQVTAQYNYTSAPVATVYFKITVTPPSAINKKSGSSAGQAQN